MMMRGERAKQFAPFDAMKGLQEALRDREEKHLRVAHHEISEEQIEKNSEVFAKLEKGNVVCMECYKDFHNITVTGTITTIDTTFCWIKVDGEKFSFQDIYAIEIIS